MYHSAHAANEEEANFLDLFTGFSKNRAFLSGLKEARRRFFRAGLVTSVECISAVGDYWLISELFQFKLPL